jgi:bifunctional NMN adenylyltransferase/nudix hydrolase
MSAERDYTHAVVIGRFQPLHNNHIRLIERAFQIADKVIVVVGSSHAAPTVKNPFSFEKRRKMIEECFPEVVVNLDKPSITDTTEYAGRLTVVGVRDSFYSDSIWVASVQALTSQYIAEGDTVALLGHYKDASSYYLNLFPQWDLIPTPGGGQKGLSGESVREKLFNLFSVDKVVKDWEGKAAIPREILDDQDMWFSYHLPGPTLAEIRHFRGTPEYTALAEEYLALKQYKESWANTPFPPQFITADAVVTCSGHVLVIKRGFNPGKGLYALPGGFVKPNERIQAAAVRELKEETRIRVEGIILNSSIVDEKVFDYPGRSLRGRTVTHAYHIKLKDGKLPEVGGGSDATGAFWMPFADVIRQEDRFFEDHTSIINHFINRT